MRDERGALVQVKSLSTHEAKEGDADDDDDDDECGGAGRLGSARRGGGGGGGETQQAGQANLHLEKSISGCCVMNLQRT